MDDQSTGAPAVGIDTPAAAEADVEVSAASPTCEADVEMSTAPAAAEAKEETAASTQENFDVAKFIFAEFVEKGKSHLDLASPAFRSGQRIDEKTVREVCADMPEVIEELDAVLATIPSDPTAERISLPRDFSYDFNEQGQLRHVKTGRKFHWVNQVHYDFLGDQIVPHIQQELMVKELGLEEVQLPSDSWRAAHGVPDNFPSHVRNNVFMTPDALSNESRLMLLIQGSGAVRAGQWARALCINDSLEMGAILGYLKRARASGMGVIVFNPNLNSCDADPLANRPTVEAMTTPGRPTRKQQNVIKIPGNSDPVMHTIHVWDELAAKAAAKDIVIVAHSAGGWCTMGLLKERPNVLDRLRAIAFTDSVHSVMAHDPPHVRGAVVNLAKNWVQSSNTLDTPENLGAPAGSGCPCVSAGHEKHEYTSAMAIDSVFRFLEEKLAVANDHQSAIAKDQ